MLVATLVFGVTYVLVSARRLGWLPLDRPAAVLLGSVATVVLGLLTPDEARAAVDGSTLLLLFGTMGMGAYLSADGFFERAASRLVARAGSRARLLGAIVWGVGILGALITNDAACVLVTPVVVALVRRRGLPPLPYLMAVATGANTGSVATLVGNPQNMLCASLGGLAYRDHLVLAAPVAVLALAINHAVLWFAFRRELEGTFAPETVSERLVSPRSMIVLGVIAATVVAFMAGFDLAWTSVAGCCVLLVLRRDRPASEIWKAVDWSILLFFAGLFVVVEGFVQSGVPAWLFERFPLAAGSDLQSFSRLSAIFLFGSNLVSNVPFILVVKDQLAALPDPRLSWELLAMASTFAGNLTLIGSVANVIVAEQSRDLGGIGFFEYLRVGAPVALATTAAGTLWLFAFG